MSGFDYFQSQGWSPIQSAAIMGNIFGESGNNPFAVGDNGRAFGIAQWQPDRQAQFQRVMGIPIQQSSLGQQYQFVNWELNHSESAAGNYLRQQTTLGGATYAFMKAYERPANMSSYGGRLNAASQYLKGQGSALKSAAINAATNVARSGLDLIVPGLGTAISGALGTFGIGGSGQQESWFQQFITWLGAVSFLQRLALGVFALILIIGGIYLLGRDTPEFKAAAKLAMAA